MTTMVSAERFDLIPKVELHCHVEGSVRPGTVLELARKAGRPLAVADPADLYRYDSLDAFLSIFWLVQETLTNRGDWARIAYESLVDGAAHGLRYREMFFTPARHLAAGQRLEEIVAGLTEGIVAAEAEVPVRCALIADVDRAFGEEAARDFVEELADLRRAGRAERVIGVGADSTELGVDLRTFLPAFDAAARAGFRRTCHAGEAVGVGPENIAIALDVLGAERIDHGIAIVEDPGLLQRVVDRRVPMTICPTSNIVIANRYTSLDQHPLPELRAAGVLLTINTDDPAMEQTDLGEEYRRVHDAFDWTFDDLAALAREGIEATWLSEDERATLDSRFRAELGALLPAPADIRRD
jgi:adenosine deaminase